MEANDFRGAGHQDSTLITEESELEEEIMAAEDTRTKILHGITRLTVKLSSITATPPEPTLTTISRSHPPTDDGTPSHSLPVVSSTSDSTLHATSHTSPMSVATVSIASPSTSCLPKLSIPIFSGDLLTWQSFWDCFNSAVNSNTTLLDVQKLSYLRAQLQGDASRVVAGFP